MGEKQIIPLTDEQFDRLWDAMETGRMMGKLLAGLVDQLAESAAKRERHAWDTVERLAGLDRGEYTFAVDWVQRVIIASPRCEES